MVTLKKCNDKLTFNPWTGILWILQPLYKEGRQESSVKTEYQNTRMRTTLLVTMEAKYTMASTYLQPTLKSLEDNSKELLPGIIMLT